MASSEYGQLVEFLGRHFADIDHRFADIDHRFAGIDRQFEAMGQQLGEVRHELVEVRGELIELRQEMLGHFDEIYRRLERLEQEYYAITQALRRIEARHADDHGRREILERDLAELKQHVAILQSRIEEIEQRLG